MLKSELLYHPELRGWSLGLMGRPLIEQPGFKNRTPHDSDLREPWTDGAPLMSKSELLHYPELREHGALD